MVIKTLLWLNLRVVRGRRRGDTIARILAVLSATVLAALPLEAQETCSRRVAWVVSYPSGRPDPVTGEGQSSNSDLFVLDPGAATPRELETERYITLRNMSFTGRSTDWSPDGRRLAFLSAGEEDMPILEKYRLGWVDEPMVPPHLMLYIVETDDLSLRRVTDVPVFTFAWSPDGSRIAFQSQYRDPSSYGQMFSPIAPAALYIVDAEGGAPKPITLLKPGIGFPVWSPDGRHIAYETFEHDPPADLSEYETTNHAIHVIDVNTMENRRLTNDPAGGSIVTWSPEGSRLAFLRSALDPNSGESRVELWVATMGEEAPVKLEIPPGTMGMWWAADGTRFYSLVEEGSGRHIAAIDVVTGQYETLAEGNAPKNREWRVWRGNGWIDRDNRRIVGLEAGKGGKHIVRELDLDTGVVRDLATIPHEAEPSDVDWSACLTR